MSIWSTIGGIAAGIGTGLIAGPAAGIAVGGSIIGKGIQSDQVSKAAKAQQAATDKTLALQGDLYNQAVARYNPYLNLGQQAVGNLGGLIGQGSSPGQVPILPPPQAQAQTPQAMAQYYGNSPNGWADYVHRKMAEVQAQQNQNQSGYSQGNG